ncbi:glycosyltransferase family 39 protein [Alkalinema sp. FACHB-956]|uniref:ArnT family glycosyltransferase n=1 Tax=Alkalinema sp. FACHB-956 TaxID=2692768 RepID=UPI0016824C97|nr:glycosyltransferase family 39 protein [Alkalinema sp. FACHB-956]MBD2329299.1 glycosyltransferase family 39 protein [Alkalinema sp. FACHB-956]
MAQSTSKQLAFPLTQHPRLVALRPYLLLLLWVLPLLLLQSGQQSLMAHDEGIYAAQAKHILETGNWLLPKWGNDLSFDRTIGIQWLIAGCYRLLGMTETAVRLPSTIAFIGTTLLLYRIGTRLLTPFMASLGAAIFVVTPLALQYAKLGTQDSVLVFIEVLAIWAMLEAEPAITPTSETTPSVDRSVEISTNLSSTNLSTVTEPSQSSSPQTSGNSPWLLLTGAAFGWGFLIKGFMIIPATISLLPYLIGANRNHRHLSNPWLYGGFILGLIPVVSWLGITYANYGGWIFEQLFGKLFHLKQQTYQGAGPLYYFWNIPANGFPWVFFGLIGIALSVVNNTYKTLLNHRWLLLVGFPVTLFVELNLFGTKTQYYPLQLFPWIAIFAAIALNHFVAHYLHDRRSQLLGYLSRAFWGLGLILLLLSVTVLAGVIRLEVDHIQTIATATAILGLGWLFPWLVWQRRSITQQATLVKHWLASVLLAPWLALSFIFATGLWGNYEASLKSFLEQPNVAQILQQQTINFVANEEPLSRRDRKRYLLLSVYTPQVGQHSPEIAALGPTAFAWLDPNQPLPNGTQVLATYEGWKLVQRSDNL